MTGMTEQEAVAAFRAELAALLKKWGADIVAKDHWTGYSECGEDVRMTATIHYDGADGLSHYAEVDMEGYVDGDAP